MEKQNFPKALVINQKLHQLVVQKYCDKLNRQVATYWLKAELHQQPPRYEICADTSGKRVQFYSPHSDVEVEQVDHDPKDYPELLLVDDKFTYNLIQVRGSYLYGTVGEYFCDRKGDIQVTLQRELVISTSTKPPKLSRLRCGNSHLKAEGVWPEVLVRAGHPNFYFYSTSADSDGEVALYCTMLKPLDFHEIRFAHGVYGNTTTKFIHEPQQGGRYTSDGCGEPNGYAMCTTQKQTTWPDKIKHKDGDFLNFDGSGDTLNRPWADYSTPDKKNTIRVTLFKNSIVNCKDSSILYFEQVDRVRKIIEVVFREPIRVGGVMKNFCTAEKHLEICGDPLGGVYLKSTKTSRVENIPLHMIKKITTDLT